MFTTLPERFKQFHLHVDVRTLLLLQKSIDRSLVRTIGDLYNVLRTFVVKSPELMGPYTRAFYDYFLSIDIRPGEALQDAVLRSETFQQWKEQHQGRLNEEDLTREDMASLFLDEVHMTHYDIQKSLMGERFGNRIVAIWPTMTTTLRRATKKKDRLTVWRIIPICRSKS